MSKCHRTKYGLSFSFIHRRFAEIYYTTNFSRHIVFKIFEVHKINIRQISNRPPG